MSAQEILKNTTSDFILLKVFHYNTKSYKWVVMERCGKQNGFAIIGGAFSSEYETIAKIVEYQELPNLESGRL